MNWLLLKRVVPGVLSSLLALTVAGCVADRLHREGINELNRGDYEDGLAKLEAAVHEDPNNLAYRLDFRARKESAVQELIAAGDTARSAGKPAEAEATYRRVLVLEPANDRARRGLEAVQADRRHAERVAKAEQQYKLKHYDAAEADVRAVLEEDPGFAPAVALAQAIDQAKGPVTAVPRLKTQENRPVSLQFRDAPTKMVFEVLARQTGINFIFDKDVKSDGKTTIFVNQVSVEQAIDLILTQNQLARQVLSENMVLVYPNTATKQKDYQDEIVHTFYLTNAAPKDAESMLKTVLGSKTLYTDDRAGQITLRDTPEHVRMAEKLIASLDVPEPEVLLEVEVLELTRDLEEKLGINYPANVAVNMTSVANPGATSLLWSDLHKQNGNTLTVSSLGVSADILKTVDMGNVLSSPRIRAKNKEKAKVLVGNRVPVVTSGTSATTGGTYSTSSVQYLDVGLTLEVQPTIHLDGDVAIKVGLEVSSILNEVDVPIGNGGKTIAYQIGTRNVSTLLELKDGETQVLAGLIQDNDTNASARLPGLGDMPVLGRLFGSNDKKRNKSEIVLSITPHIIRAQTRPSSEDTEFWYGTETQTRTAPFSSGPALDTAPSAGTAAPFVPGGVSFGAGSGSQAAAGGNPALRVAPTHLDAAAGPALPPPAAGAGSAAAWGPNAAGAPSAAAGTEAASPAQPEAKSAGQGATNTTQTNAAPATPKISIEGPSSAAIGETVNVAVKLAAANPPGHVRAQVRFDAQALQLVSAEPGDLAPSDSKLDLRPGGVQLEYSGADGGSGTGTLVTLHFRPVLARPVQIATQVILVGEDGAAMAATPTTPLKLTITP